MDIEKFRSANFEARTAEVECMGLRSFFPEGEKPIVKVRGLTGEEVARARVRVRQNKAMAETVSKLLSGKASDQAEAVKAALGLSDDAPDDLVYRIAMSEFGIVSFPCSQSDAVRFADACPEDFYRVTSKIIELTGIGKSLGE